MKSQPLYDSIGSAYCVTRRPDPRITRDLARLVGVRQSGRFLDLACGTGNYTRALAEIGGEWSGLDVSEVMLAQAASGDSSIRWNLGDATDLPFEDAVFDGVVCSLAIHHFQELQAPFCEVWRVLRSGTFVIFTAFPEQLRRYWLCHYFPTMMRRSAETMPDERSVVAALAGAGFECDPAIPFEITNDLEDLFLFSGKGRPELYLDPLVRANISSFASLCSQEELEAGLRLLRDDLVSGRFDSIARQYSSSAGDYAYVVARKNV